MSGGKDPRPFQIATLGALVAYGFARSDFHLAGAIALAIVGAALLSQLAASRLLQLVSFDPKSALISALSLCLLLRTQSMGLGVAAAILAVSSKFLLRVDQRHVFNPTNFALVVLLIVSPDKVWVSPGQWGTEVFFLFILACVGGLVTYRACRSDVTLTFLLSYGAIVFARAGWLGEPASIPLHHLQNGALVLFAFFMISDPKTTPDSTAGRRLFAITVAMGAAVVQYVLFQPNGLLWALVCAAPLTPVLNRLFPGTRYEWHRPTPAPKLPLSERTFA